MPFGMLIRLYSSGVRPSTTTRFSPFSNIALSSAAEIEGVWAACSTTSPKALDGTLTPLKMT